MPPCPSKNGVNGGCAMIGSATLIFRMIANGARKNTSSQRYGNPIANRCQVSRRPVMSAGQGPGALGALRHVDPVVPLAEAVGRTGPVLRACLHDLSGLEPDPVQRQVAVIPQVVDDALELHVLEAFGLALADEDLFRPDGD